MKLKEWVSKNIDGICHFLVNYSLMVTLGLMGLIFNGIVLGIFVSFGKEIYDGFSYGGFSWKDILFDFAGLILALIVVILMRRI